jgi:hypothetical protein
VTATKRWVLWIVLLAGVVGLIAFERDKPQVGAIVDVAPRHASGQSGSDAAAGSPRARSEAPMILAIRPRTLSGKVDDAFPVRDWRPPRSPAARPGPPPKAVAPRLPFTVLGKKLEDGAWHVFLGRDERILVVKTLDTIDNAYRVDEIRPPVMTLTYLPLQQQQLVAIGGGE